MIKRPSCLAEDIKLSASREATLVNPNLCLTQTWGNFLLFFLIFIYFVGTLVSLIQKDRGLFVIK